jgi:hypothetical protein
MSLKELRRIKEEYRIELEQIAHKYDKEVRFLKTLHDNLQNYEEQEKSMISDGCIPPQNKKNTEIEWVKYLLFSFEIVLPLNCVLDYYDSKGKWMFDPELLQEIDFDFDAIKHTPRDIFKLIMKLPEYLVLATFNDYCSNNRVDALFDAYKQQDEEGFVREYNQLQPGEKQKIQETLISIGRGINCSMLMVELGGELENSESFESDFHLVAEQFNEYVNEDKELASVFGGMFSREGEFINDNNTAIYFQKAKDLYKQDLLFRMVNEYKMDSFTKDIIEKIIQNPDYLDITNELLTECEDTIRITIAEFRKKNNSTGQDNQFKLSNKPFPLPFPEHLEINKNKQNVFFKTLYNELVKRKFISNDTSLTDFQYLLGGEKPEDYNGAKIVWLYTKTQLHCFFICYYGDTAGKKYGWKVLNKMFTIEGDDHLENNPSDVKSASSEPYIDTFKSIIERAKKGQTLDYL